MPFSPRTRPDTVNLAFSDPDITDTYRDERSSAAASSPRARHPRGDTPLSRRQGDWDDSATSSGRWSASRRSASAFGGEDGQDELRELSNLDKLLLLLDGEGDDEDEPLRASKRAAGRLAATSTPPPTHPRTSSAPPPAPTTARRSNATYADHQAQSRRNDEQSLHIGASADLAGSKPPAQRTAHSSSFRPSLAGRPPSTIELLQRANGFVATGQDPLISPSPRPGSVAALRKSEGERSGSDLRRMGGEENGGAAGHGRLDVDDGEGTVASLDSVARVAEAALREFDTIVSQHSTLQPTDRPPSRLRNIPSRTASGAPPNASATPGRAYGGMGSPAEATNTNLQLVHELREAQDYIAYLQQELHTINGVVLQLRDRPGPDTAPSDGAHSRTPAAVPVPPAESPQMTQARVDEAAQAAFEVVKHTVAMLPSLPSPPTAASASPSLLSLHRALAFTRAVDQLAHHSPDLRRDELIFGEENLRGVLRRVGTWERVVRTGDATTSV
ncbi:uncharacterized protein JCM10292_001679 [Rhodotorula paludigena]|uniref:uncharacterized protein n=1 Tax=Rhodotorula paludigena TaxID=86838 RepID=UPI00317E6B03